MLDDYLESVREIERRVQKMEARDLSQVDAARTCRSGMPTRSTST